MPRIVSQRSNYSRDVQTIVRIATAIRADKRLDLELRTTLAQKLDDIAATMLTAGNVQAAG